MKKQKYSLTAKERKEMRRKEQEAAEKKNQKNHKKAAENSAGDAGGPDAAVSEKRFSRKSVLIISVAMVLVLVLLGGALFGFLMDWERRPDGNPIAAIHLSNGMVLKFEIYEKEAPMAATNFMALAFNGFFNGTIIHDNQNDWVRFGGYTTENKEGGGKKHISENDAFCRSFKGLKKYDYEWAEKESRNIFHYRLKEDTTAPSFNNEEGLLCFLYNNSSSMYQMSAVKNASTMINGSPKQQFTVFGRYADEKTMENLRALNVYHVDPDKTDYKSPWYYPKDMITIKSIKITNYFKKDWKEIRKGYDVHIESIGGTWTKSSSFLSGI